MEPKRVQPSPAGDAAEFVMSMRQLKDQSGCSLRQLEEKAASQGNVLARSTIADILGRDTLPRVEQLAAFVRACGAEDQLQEWLQARERIATGQHLTPTDPVPPDTAPDDRPSRVLPVAAALLVIAAAAVILLITIPTGTPTTTTSPPTHSTQPQPETFPVPSAGGWGRIHPARSPGLCVTEGRDRGGRYRSAIAVQRPCTEPGGPRTFLQPVDTYTTHIEWEHPIDKGMGCLTILDDGPAKDFLEPQGECQNTKNSQVFRIERTAPGGNTYRLRRTGTDLCVAIPEDTVGAEARQQRCTADDRQNFLIDLVASLPPSSP